MGGILVHCEDESEDEWVLRLSSVFCVQHLHCILRTELWTGIYTLWVFYIGTDWFLLWRIIAPPLFVRCRLIGVFFICHNVEMYLYKLYFFQYVLLITCMLITHYTRYFVGLERDLFSICSVTTHLKKKTKVFEYLKVSFTRLVIKCYLGEVLLSKIRCYYVEFEHITGVALFVT